MDAIREQLNRPLIAGLAGLIAGILIGLIVLGWWLFPVRWVDATPAELRHEDKVEYLRMAIEAYAQTGDAGRAIARYRALGEDANEVLSEVVRNPEGLPPETIQAFGTTVLAGTIPGVEGTPLATPEPGTPDATPVAGEAPAAGGFVRTLLIVLCAITLLLAAALVVVFIIRSRGGASAISSPRAPLQPIEREAPWTEYTPSGGEPPLAQFMSSYRMGEDNYNESFGIESPSGEYLGECGVEISETIVPGEPKKVTAFEVWLFDKNDYQTVTKVMMSQHSFSDDNFRQRLEAKGTPVMAVPDAETVLETQTLRMVARVVDMGYGDGVLPAESFFDRFTLELSVWVIRTDQRYHES